LFSVHPSRAPHVLLSFPTRRSSDLAGSGRMFPMEFPDLGSAQQHIRLTYRERLPELSWYRIAALVICQHLLEVCLTVFRRSDTWLLRLARSRGHGNQISVAGVWAMAGLRVRQHQRIDRIHVFLS